MGDFPSLEARHVSTWLQLVVTISTRNWHKCYCVRIMANFLNVGTDFFNYPLVSLLAIVQLNGIHFNTNNQLFHAQCVSQKGMVMGLPVLGATFFKFTASAATIRTAQSA